MYNNIGEKIKRLAKILCLFETVIIAIFGIILLSTAESYLDSITFENESIAMSYFLYGIILVVGSFPISLINSFFVYGFGQLIENTSKDNDD